MAGPWQGSSTCSTSQLHRDHFPGGFYQTENRDLASIKPQKPRIRRVSQAVTAWAQHCWGQAEQRVGSATAQGHVPTQPLRHPLDTLRARRGGDCPVATWNGAGLLGSAGSAPYLHKSCLHKRRSKPRLAPGGHTTGMPRGRGSTHGHSVAGGSPQRPGSPGWAVPTQLPPFARILLNPRKSTQCARMGEPRTLGVQGGCGRPRGAQAGNGGPTGYRGALCPGSAKAVPGYLCQDQPVWQHQCHRLGGTGRSGPAWHSRGAGLAPR